MISEVGKFLQKECRKNKNCRIILTGDFYMDAKATINFINKIGVGLTRVPILNSKGSRTTKGRMGRMIDHICFRNMDSHPFRSEVIKNIDLSDHLPVTASWAMDKIGAQKNSTKKMNLEKIAINADKIVNNNRFSALLHLDSETKKIISGMQTAAKSVADELNSAAEKNSHFDVTLSESENIFL
ncbi:hypothetical protein AYI70_g8559 [Smittium culicis]|uniref:Endonuclease/exonuclease/phosphatase domain-containing protein n=1 Tax=Smittium culicis TaxID=133412 RepID=A0A1R1XFD7_9FUNG|nr:hypothetical protein AYI70_g8559 [Smittium culicis]